MRRLTLVTRRGIVLTAAATLSAAACSDYGGSGDTARFCELVQDNVTALRANPTTAEEIDTLIDLWEDVGARAPLAIEPDWAAHILTFETARDSEDQEEILARMYATEGSSVAVAAWLEENCAVDWGPVATVLQQTTTTLTPPTSAPG